MKINRRLPKKKMIVLGAVLLAVAGGLTAYALYRHQVDVNNSKNATYNPSTMNSDPNVPKPSDTKSNGGITQSPSPTTSAPTPNSGVTPSSPIGIFASSHHVSLSAGAVEQSTCSTTPGAQCQIVFTMNNVKRTLDAKATDSNGNVEWVWNIKDVGFTAGEWTITANASIGSNVSSSNDAMKLEISQ